MDEPAEVVIRVQKFESIDVVASGVEVRRCGKALQTRVQVHPSPTRQVTMPAQHKRQLDEDAPATRLGERPPKTGEDRLVGRVECRSCDLASTNGHFVAKHRDLDGQIRAFASDAPGDGEHTGGEALVRS